MILLEKKKVLNLIKDLPDNFSIDEMIDRIVLLQKVEIGLEQSRNGQILNMAEAKLKIGRMAFDLTLIQPRKGSQNHAYLNKSAIRIL